MVYKLVDPAVQSILFILLIYTTDTNRGDGDIIKVAYPTVFKMLLGVQLFSVAVNFFLGELNVFKFERLAYLGSLIAFFIIRAVISNFQERYLELFAGTNLPLKETFIMVMGSALAFWYFVICFREIRNLLKREDDDD